MTDVSQIIKKNLGCGDIVSLVNLLTKNIELLTSMLPVVIDLFKTIKIQ